MTIEADLPGKPVAIITRRGSYVGPFLGAEVEQWELLERANLDMVFWPLQAVLPPMVPTIRSDGRKSKPRSR